MTRFARWSSIAFALCVLPVLAEAQQSARVPVASHEIARGVVLTAADIGYLLSDKTPARPARADAPTAIEPAAAGDTLVGWMTRRLIAAGEPLRSPAVAPPQLVKSGDLVDVVYQSDGILITMRGRATRSAALGERLTVRMDSQRKLDATVVSAGRVRVN